MGGPLDPRQIWAIYSAYHKWAARYEAEIKGKELKPKDKVTLRLGKGRYHHGTFTTRSQTGGTTS